MEKSEELTLRQIIGAYWWFLRVIAFKAQIEFIRWQYRRENRQHVQRFKDLYK